MEGNTSNPKPNAFNYLNVICYLLNVLAMCFVGVDRNLLFKYQTLVTPADWTLAIWFLIFIADGVFILAQLRQKYCSSAIVQDGVKFYFIPVCLGQILWLYSFFRWEIIILSFLSTLVVLFSLIQIFKAHYFINSEEETPSEYWTFRFPFEVHVGWITAASFASFNTWLVALDASSTILLASAIISLISIFVLALGSMWYLGKPNFVIASAICWAAFGISQELRQPKQSIFAAFSDRSIDMTNLLAAFVATFILVAVIVRGIKMIIKRRHTEKVLELTKSQEAAASAAAGQSDSEAKEPSADYIMA